MKLLAVCEGGTVRSVSLGLVLKMRGVDVIAASWRWNSVETMKMLCRWADRIIVVQPEIVAKIPSMFRRKVTVYDVGPDTYGNPLRLDLCLKYLGYVSKDPKMPRGLRKLCAVELKKYPQGAA